MRMKSKSLIFLATLVLAVAAYAFIVTREHVYSEIEGADGYAIKIVYSGGFGTSYAFTARITEKKVYSGFSCIVYLGDFDRPNDFNSESVAVQPDGAIVIRYDNNTVVVSNEAR